MTDSIALRNIRAFGRHGNDAGEREVPQAFDIDVRLSVDLRRAGASDALADTIDYAALYGDIARIVKTTSYALLERLGEDLLARILADDRVVDAEVCIAKPQLLGGATPSVTLRRARGGTPARARIGIGSNAADAPVRVEAAIAALGRLGTVAARSSLYRTKAWGVAEQPDFVNAAALLDTVLSPHALLHELKRIEGELGRVPTYRWGPRAIDLDILAYDDVRLTGDELTIPHAHLAERAFALVPLAEIDRSFTPLLAALPADARAGVVKL